METQEGNQKDMYWTETNNKFNNSEYVFIKIILLWKVN